MGNVKKLFSGLLLSLGVITSFISCQKDGDQIIKGDQVQQKVGVAIQEKISKLGLSGSSAVDMGSYYVVEGDIMLSKNLDVYFNGDSKLKQAQYTSLVTNTNAQNITVFVDPSIPTSGTDNWRDAVQAAISEWNNAGSAVRMTYTTSTPADIVISSDLNTLSNPVLAQGSFPSGGKPGPSIIINLDFYGDYQLSASQKKYNMVHELGHCLGFRHTNWRQQGEATAATIAGTPNSTDNPDPNSIMNGGTALNSWNGFSAYDIVAVKALYPAVGIQVQINGPGSGYANTTRSYSATITGYGYTSPISYEWYLSEEDSEDWVLISTSSTASFELVAMYYNLRLVVRSANGLEATAEKPVANKGEHP